MRHAASCISLLVACFGLLATASAQDFEVRLVRPAVVGERYGMVSIGSQEQRITTTINGQGRPPRDEAMTVTLAAKAEVLAVTKNGREAKTRFTVTTLTKAMGSQVTDLLPAGTVVVAEESATKTEFQVAGAPAMADMAEALALVISLDSDQSTNDDDVMGTKERKKVGDAWAIDSKLGAAEFAAKGGLKVDPAKFTGTSNLVEVLPTGMRVTTAMAIRDVGFPLPAGLAITSSAFRAAFSRILPLDTTKRAIHHGMSMDGTVECAGKVNDMNLTMVIIQENREDVTFTAP